jgi:hypothetical protein
VLFERMGQLLGNGKNAVRYRCAPADGAFSPAMLAGEAEAPPLKRLVFRNGAFIPSADLLDEEALAADRETLRQSL